MTKRDKTEFLNRINDAEAELVAIKNQFLRNAGWVSTSQTPGCFWLWCKTFKVWVSEGEFKMMPITANTDFAVAVERAS